MQKAFLNPISLSVTSVGLGIASCLCSEIWSVFLLFLQSAQCSPQNELTTECEFLHWQSAFPRLFFFWHLLLMFFSFFLSDEATKLVYKEGTDHQQQQQLLFRCFNAQLMEICGHMCRLRSNQRCLSETFLLLFTGTLHQLKEAMQIFIAISILVPLKAFM